MSPIKNALRFVYSSLNQTRGYLYDQNILKSVKINSPVISIGNITVGGTGKTPITDYLIQVLKKHQHRVALVSRSYKAEASAPEKINIKKPRAAVYYGDEPTWIAEHHQDVPVYVGSSKSETAQVLSQHENVDVVLIDDGFQHRRLERDLDIVILDATESFSNYQLLPVGRAREGWDALERASGIFITKVNLAEQEHLKVLKSKLNPEKPIFEFAYKVKELREFRTDEVKKINDLNETVFGFCGIARPETFQGLVKQDCPHISMKAMHFPDHHGYTDEDIEKIIEAARQSNAQDFITTEKDAIKLKESWPQDKKLWMVVLELVPKEPESLFYEFISQIFS